MSAEVAETIARVRAWRDDRRRTGQRVGFVPTMGALHEGHARLIETARQRGDHVVVSIFVNPLQFDRKDDLERSIAPLRTRHVRRQLVDGDLQVLDLVDREPKARGEVGGYQPHDAEVNGRCRYANAYVVCRG